LYSALHKFSSLIAKAPSTFLTVMSEVLNRAFSVFPDSLVFKRLCRDIILRLQPKNLGLIIC
jgi:hypothetical protein